MRALAGARVPDEGNQTARVEDILRDLVDRGLIPRGARGPRARPGPGVDSLGGQDGPVFVSACGLRNLHVLNHLYGAALGDLARQVTREVASAVLAVGDPEAEILSGPGPDVVLRHGSASRRRVEAVVHRLQDVLAAVSLPAGAGAVGLRPVVSTLELRAPSAWSTDDVLRTLHEIRTRALASERGLALLEGPGAEEALSSLRRRDASLVWVTEALRLGRVEVHFQPVIDLRSGRLEDVEALARIRGTERLLVANEFIDLVHDLGETASLDAEVLRAVARSAPTLARATRRLFVNVSPLSLGATAFRGVMSETIGRLQAEGVNLVVVLELTEQALLEHHDTIREIHREHGVHFAVDDFGTGYSSLRTVSELAVRGVISTLKIDGSLTRQIAESSEGYKVVLAVAQMARSLDLRVIAEHVETPEILARLRTTGIECGQGFLFDPPLPVEALVSRYEGKAPFEPEPAPRRGLLLLEPYLERAFAAFYDTLLSDPHFARYFRDEEQVRSLIERQRQTFLESLGDEPEALRRRYVRLGRLHAELGLPLATFLKGADLLHQELLGVLLHASSEIALLRDTERFFASLRELMARGYLEHELPRRREELSSLQAWARELVLPEGLAEEILRCADAILSSVEARRAAPPASSAHGTRPAEIVTEADPPTPQPPPRLDKCPLTAALGALQTEGASVARDHHARFHADAENLDFFLARDEDAAVAPLLEALMGRLPLILVALRES